MRAQIQTHVGPTRRERIAATLAVAGHKASLTRTHGIFQSTKTQGKAQAVRPSPLHEETARSSRADFLPRSSAAIGLKVYTFVTAIMVTSSPVEVTISLPILFKQPHSVTFRQFFCRKVTVLRTSGSGTSTPGTMLPPADTPAAPGAQRKTTTSAWWK